ncbi:MAG: hypothetical protein QXM93_04600 [Candidatus Methanomethyliaceae archaeon]
MKGKKRIFLKKGKYLLSFLYFVFLLGIGANETMTARCNRIPCQNEGNLIFYSERVMLFLAAGEMTVEGVYFFRNTSLKERTVIMYYPFFIDAAHPYPEWIDVEGFNFVKEPQGISWRMSFPACSDRVLRVRYRQKLYVNTAVYILTSTQEWREPLRNAEFIITVPLEWRELTFSYTPNRCAVKNGLAYYYIFMKNFMPNKDLVISWN